MNKILRCFIRTQQVLKAVVVLLSIPALLQAEESTSFKLIPERVIFSGDKHAQRFLLQKYDGKRARAEVRENIQWTVSNPEIASVDENGLVSPLQVGSVTLTATVNGRQSTSEIVVQNLNDTSLPSFQNDVLPILSKAGCNMGACHGAVAGKGGFRLSLHGYDPASDFFNIVKQDRGRRVEFAQPGQSLILTKPSGGTAHRGGVRILPESEDYRILADWIANAAPAPTEEEAVVERIEVLPERVELALGETQRILVQAHFSNGQIRDVTAWTRWTSTNEAVCRVDQDGNVTIVGPGEGAISAWYSSKLSLARVTVPYKNELPADLFNSLPARNFIDEQINVQLARLNLPPSPRCDDVTFIRRVFLDTIGLPPTSEEISLFLANTSETKRDELIEQLLQRPEFVDYWTYKWSDVLMVNGQLLRPQAVKQYYSWIHQHVEKNTPWDEIVRQVLTANGDTLENGATNFYALFQTPEEMTENASQAFLGLSLACAKCHNHPLEKWTNDQYYAMANLFSRVRSKGWGGEPRGGDGARTVFVVQTGELVQPRTGLPQPPTPLDGEPLAFDDAEDRRIALADWLTSSDNPYFAKAITNRIWANFFGVGLVESVDDMRVSNPASNEELLEQAANYLVAEKFDLKSLMRQILQSHAYQRSSHPVRGNEEDKRFYSRYFPRRLQAEVLHDAVVAATGVPTEFSQVTFIGGDSEKTSFYPAGTRAIQLYDSAVDSYFLKAFGRNPRNIVCECERTNEPSMIQVLHISNGSTINSKLEAGNSIVTQIMAQWKSGMSVESLIDQVYLRCLSRYPDPSERQELTQLLVEAGPEERRQVVEDLFWGLLSSREFVFNH